MCIAAVQYSGEDGRQGRAAVLQRIGVRHQRHVIGDVIGRDVISRQQQHHR